MGALDFLAFLDPIVALENGISIEISLEDVGDCASDTPFLSVEPQDGTATPFDPRNRYTRQREQ